MAFASFEWFFFLSLCQCSVFVCNKNSKHIATCIHTNVCLSLSPSFLFCSQWIAKGYTNAEIMHIRKINLRVFIMPFVYAPTLFTTFRFRSNFSCNHVGIKQFIICVCVSGSQFFFSSSLILSWIQFRKKKQHLHTILRTLIGSMCVICVEWLPGASFTIIYSSFWIV